MPDRIITTDQGYTISYSGGRLADMLMDGVAVEVVQVRDYDWDHGKVIGPEPSDDEIRASVRTFLDPQDMSAYQETADFYNR